MEHNIIAKSNEFTYDKFFNIKISTENTIILPDDCPTPDIWTAMDGNTNTWPAFCGASSALPTTAYFHVDFDPFISATGVKTILRREDNVTQMNLAAIFMDGSKQEFDVKTSCDASSNMMSYPSKYETKEVSFGAQKLLRRITISGTSSTQACHCFWGISDIRIKYDYMVYHFGLRIKDIAGGVFALL